ncbi:MAG: type II toxin-antitoxin system VapC family toxin, partial [Bradyrhizobium sp.]
ACTALIRRIEQADVAGFVSVHTLIEVAHRVMTIEAAAKHGWPFAGIARRLKRHTKELQALTGFRQAVESVPLLGIQILDVAARLVPQAAVISQQVGLLTGDALVVAVMQAHGLTDLASHDGDFDRVSWLTRYEPL